MPEAAVAASICVAVLGALLSYLYTRRLERRKARLERLNAQLREFCTQSLRQPASLTFDS